MKIRLLIILLILSALMGYGAADRYSPHTTDIIPAGGHLYAVGYDGGEIVMELPHGVEYTVDVTDEPWLHAAGSRACVRGAVKIKVDANSSAEDRSATVIFSSTDREYTKSVAVVQKGRSGHPSGYVIYSDGAPAVNVSVSDGFTVTSTDDRGYFKIPAATPDARYIYISYPSDAGITVSDGCPQFFRTYTADDLVIFTLERQNVENEFALFALADPQAHYAIRGVQIKSDIQRFADESVPAVNATVKSLDAPCYGVTLGDIVYSQGSRNSNPGLTLMRTQTGHIGMPVFQTFGNHDYTYFYSNCPLSTDSCSSTLYLKAQRSFEECFGPVNLSFNRGDAHIVCMRNVIYDSEVSASSYHGGFTDAQYRWLQEDLANVSRDKMVILCVHIPISRIEEGENVAAVLDLLKQYSNPTIFSGHTHYFRGVPDVASTGIFEHIHSAVCGQWWWSRIEGDGCPNGYTVYKIKGNCIADAYFTGVNEGMNTRDCQMRIYRGNTLTGGTDSTAVYFQWPHSDRTFLINVFNGDSRWKVKVYENGEFKGFATLMENSKACYDSVTEGQTYTVPEMSNQDWWAIGYHIGVCRMGRSNRSYYTNMYHMWKYVADDADAEIKVEAVDPFGNVYTCEDVLENTSTSYTYPDYVREPLNLRK